ncbi:hypothetical protein GS504_15890 [Rhodococcus hoagii]|nr:hypothetical protein [Prescottella equi]NKS58935.1 hypothetical protein [Prescottella equi]NKS71547.1 hypothetical protein [Prescottella equi]
MPETLRVIVSGKTYDACLDPNATDVPAEYGLPEPTVTRFGRGHRHDYGDLPLPLVDRLLGHLWTMSEIFTAPDADAYTRAEGRAIRADYERIETAHAAAAGK